MTMKLQAITANRVFRLLKETAMAWVEDNAFRLSAALAYFSVFSLAPLLIIAISVAGLVLGEEAVRGQLDSQLARYIGEQAATAVQGLVQSASKPGDGWIGAIIGFVTLLIGASGVFVQLKDALNSIWGVKLAAGAGVKSFLRDRLLNFGMVHVIGFLLMVSLMMTTALAGVSQYIERLAGMPTGLIGLLAFFLSFGVVTTLFAFIFKVLPDAKIEWRNVWTGALVTALLFEICKFGLGWYLGRESTASSYGASGSVVLLLLWVNYSACILLFGAEFTQVYARDTGHEIQPTNGAVFITQEICDQQGLTPFDGDQREAPPQVPTIEEAHPPSGRSPVGALLAVSAASFLVGWLAVRRTEEPRRH